MATSSHGDSTGAQAEWPPANRVQWPTGPFVSGRTTLWVPASRCEALGMETAKKFERILLATDGSRQSDGATRTATTLASASGASVRIVHVWNMAIREKQGLWDLETRGEAEVLVQSAAKQIAGSGVIATGEVLRADDKDIAEAVAGAAKDFNADLVVVGSRGLSEWQAMRKHSVSRQLLNHLDCPVLVVSERPVTAGSGVKVMLAIAGGEDIVPGVRAAAAAAAAPGSKVLIAHVRIAIFGMAGESFIEGDEEAQASVTKTNALLQELGVTTETMVLEPGPVAAGIAEVARTWGADLIVTGSGRYGSLSAWVLGSVSHDLMHISDRPVLVAERLKV